MTISVDPGLVKFAKEKQINVSGMVEEGLRKAAQEVVKLETCKERLYCCVCGEECEQAFRCENTGMIYCEKCCDDGIKMCMHKNGEHVHVKIK